MLLLDRQEQFELWGQLLLRIETVWEINPSYSAVGVNCDSKSFNIVAAIGPSCEVWQVELNLVPSFIKPHGHSTNKRLYSCCRLVIRCSESPPNVLVIKNLNFKGEVLFELNEWRGTFLMIMTRKGSLIPRVSFYCWGQVMKAVVTLVPIISRTDDWISWSVRRLMCPLWTEWGMSYFACPRFEVVCSLWSRGWKEILIGKYF